MYKVIATDGMDQAGIDVFKSTSGITLEVRKGVKPDELLNIIGDYDGLIVRSATKVTAEVIEAGKKLKVIGRAGVGVDNVDVKAASRRGIVVMNTPEANTISTAEHTVAMMCALARQIPRADALMKQGQWEKKALTGVELYGKTLGIIGFGRIGSWVARICQGFGMQVLAYDPVVAPERILEAGATPVSLDELFAQSDFITVHTPVNNETRNLVRKETIAKMKDGVRLINCARGGIFNEDDLCDAIDSGKVAGAALDVFPKEPNENTRLLKYHQLVLTPHIAASTDEAQSRVSVEIARQIVQYLTSGLITNAVNVPAVSSQVLQQLLPFVELGSRMGTMLAQIAPGKLTQLNVSYEGELAAMDTAPITNAITASLLAANVEGVNQVNARLIADEIGLKVTEHKTTSSKNYANYIRAEVSRSGAEPVSVGATIFGENRQHPRIVRINHSHVDAVPEGYLLIVPHVDQPGILGKIGTILGNHNINISRMTCDRLQPGSTNFGVYTTDQDIPEHVLEEIRAVKGILGAYRVVF